MTEISETLDNLRTLAEMSRVILQGVRKARLELKQSDIEVPEILNRSLHRLDMDLDDLAFDLEQMTK